MDLAQHLTIKEYFKSSMAQQHKFMELRWKFAREYMKKHGLVKDGIRDLVVAIREIAAEKNIPITEEIRSLAHKHLFDLILADMMEFVAEFGLQTLQARYDDAVDDMQQSWGRYSSWDLLEQTVDIRLVPSTERPLMIVTETDLQPPNYQFLTMSSFNESKKTWDDLIEEKKAEIDAGMAGRVVDYDNMSESEWQDAIEKRDAELRKNNAISDGEDDYQQSLLNEYEAEKEAAFKAAQYLSPTYPDWIGD